MGYSNLSISRVISLISPEPDTFSKLSPDSSVDLRVSKIVKYSGCRVSTFLVSVNCWTVLHGCLITITFYGASISATCSCIWGPDHREYTNYLDRPARWPMSAWNLCDWMNVESRELNCSKLLYGTHSSLVYFDPPGPRGEEPGVGFGYLDTVLCFRSRCYTSSLRCRMLSLLFFDFSSSWSVEGLIACLCYGVVRVPVYDFSKRVQISL